MASNKKPSATSSYVPSMMQVKKEPLPTDRLSSFRIRDLTLGGVPLKTPIARPNLVANNKKIYTPNLNAVRNKNVDVKTSRDTTISNRGRGGRGGRASDRGRGGAGPNTKNSRNAIISSSGLFSEGAGDGSNKQLFRSFRNEGTSTASSLRRPVLSAKREKADPQAERKQIAEIYDLDEDFADGGPDQSISNSNDVFSPIILRNAIPVKTEVKLEDRVGAMDIKNETDSKPNMQSELEYPNSLGEFFERTSPQLFLLQMPDALPGYGAEAEPADSAESQNPSKPETNFCTMANLEEGRIGRLVRYRSGRTKLFLGDSQFDIDLGINPNLLQQVVSIAHNQTERSGNVTELGKINAKLSAVPDWESMLNNIGDKKS